MKKLLLIASLLMVSWGSHPVLNAQEPEWVWAKSFGGSGYDYATAAHVDKDGNILVVGGFSSPTISFGSYTLTNQGTYNNLFLVKYDSDGNVLWAIADGYDAAPYAVATDSEGSIYTIGFYTGNDIQFGDVIFFNSGIYDLYLVKYDNNGNFEWVRTAQGDHIDYGNAIVIDSEDNIYISGGFWSSPLVFDTIELYSEGIDDIYLVKYNKHGEVLWGKSFGGVGQEFINGMNVDETGNIYLTGKFYSPSFSFGDDELILSGPYNPPGFPDFFLVKYDSNGNEIWGRSVGNGIGSSGNSIAFDFAGNPFIAGEFFGDSIEFGSTTLTGNDDAFVVKYSAEGDVEWAKNIVGNTRDYGRYIKFHENSLYLYGFTYEYNANSSAGFISKLNINGDDIWTITIENSSDVVGLDIDVHSNLYLAGEFESSSITFGNTTLHNQGRANLFFAKLNDSPLSVQEFTKEKFTLYPNPFSTQATLFAGSELHNATLTITNALGQVVKRMENLNGNSVTINRENLVAGIYYWILAENQEVLAAKKISIQ